jgi:hypothetical protein
VSQHDRTWIRQRGLGNSGLKRSDARESDFVLKASTFHAVAVTEEKGIPAYIMKQDKRGRELANES